jgi:hypothetical protein
MEEIKTCLCGHYGDFTLVAGAELPYRRDCDKCGLHAAGAWVKDVNRMWNRLVTQLEEREGKPCAECDPVGDVDIQVDKCIECSTYGVLREWLDSRNGSTDSRDAQG